MRLFIAITLLTLFMVGCQQTSKQSIQKDVTHLIKIEKKIIDLTIQNREQNQPGLIQKRDSLSNVLQEISDEYQEKYKKSDNLKQFQKAYHKAKQEAFTK